MKRIACSSREPRDSYRLPRAEAREGVAALVEDGTRVAATVEGWPKRAYVHRDVAAPGVVDARALLSPFDNLIWYRDRTHRMFGMKFRLEVYTPAEKRQHGYYVLPFLMDDALVARVDLKRDRQARRLIARNIHLEPNAPPNTKKHSSRSTTGILRSIGVLSPDKGV